MHNKYKLILNIITFFNLLAVGLFFEFIDKKDKEYKNSFSSLDEIPKNLSTTIFGCPFYPSKKLSFQSLHCSKLKIPMQFIDNCEELENRLDLKQALLDIVTPDKSKLTVKTRVITIHKGLLICDTSFWGGKTLRYEQDSIIDESMPEDWVNEYSPLGLYSRKEALSTTPGQLLDDFECAWLSEVRTWKKIISIEEIHTIWDIRGLLLYPTTFTPCYKYYKYCHISAGTYILRTPGYHLNDTQERYFPECDGDILSQEKGIIYWDNKEQENSIISFSSTQNPFFLQIPNRLITRSTNCKVPHLRIIIGGLLYRLWFDLSINDKLNSDKNNIIDTNLNMFKMIKIEGALNNVFKKLDDYEKLTWRLDCKNHKEYKELLIALALDGVVSPLAAHLIGHPYVSGFLNSDGEIIACGFTNYTLNCLESITKWSTNCLCTENYSIRLNDLTIGPENHCNCIPTSTTSKTISWRKGTVTINQNLTLSYNYYKNNTITTPLPNFLKLGSLTGRFGTTTNLPTRTHSTYRGFNILIFLKEIEETIYSKFSILLEITITLIVLFIVYKFAFLFRSFLLIFKREKTINIKVNNKKTNQESMDLEDLKPRFTNREKTTKNMESRIVRIN